MQRREVLISALFASFLPKYSFSQSGLSPDPFQLSATQLAIQLREGHLGIIEHVRAVIERVEAAKALNAFISFDPEKLLAEARKLDQSSPRQRQGALFGIPIPIKDSVNTADFPTSGGTKALRNFRPKVDAPVVARLRTAGALVLGKTNLHELSYGWTSNNLAFGAVHNPYALGRIPGGSSGGTAAAVAARLAPFGVAEDTEGSIRVPAALCGLAGFRPSTGRYSTEGAIPISKLFDQIGPVATHAEDLGLFDQLIGPDQTPVVRQSLKGVRIAVAQDPMWIDLHPDVESAARIALAKLEAAGAVLVHADFAELSGLVTPICEPIQNHDVRVTLSSYLKQYGAGIDFDAVVAATSADIRAVFEHDILPGSPGFVEEAQYRDMVDVQLPRLRRAYADFYARTQTQAIVFPTTRITAPRIGDEDSVDIGGRSIDFTRALAGNIAPGSTAGLPGLVLPIGLDPQGLPLSIEFDGPRGSDRFLLGLATELEHVFGRLAPPKFLAP